MFALYLGLSIIFFASAWRDPFHQAPGGGSDAQQSMWFLSWTAVALAHGLNPFVTHYLDYPYGANLMWNTSLLLPGALFTPLTLTLGPVFTYNTMLTLALATSAFAAFLLGLRLTGSRVGAAVAGLVYGFSPFALAEAASHAFLSFTWAPPLVLLLGYELFSVQERRPVLLGLGLGTVIACQLLISEEILAVTLLLGTIGIIAVRRLGIDFRGRSMRFAAMGLATAVLPVTLLDFFPLKAQFFGPQRLAGVIHGADLYVSDLASFVVPTKSFAIAPGWLTSVSDQFTGNVNEWTSYLGIPLAILVGFLIVRAWRRNGLWRWVAFMTMAAAVLSLGPFPHLAGRELYLPLPWMLFQFLPLFRDVLPTRISLFTDLGVALLLAFFLVEKRPLDYRRLLIVGLALIPLVPSWPPPTYPRSAPRFFSAGEVEKVIPAGSVVLVAPLASGAGLTGKTAILQEASAMGWQAACGMCFKMPEGYVLAPSSSGAAQPGPPETRLELDMVSIANGEAVSMPQGAERQSILDHLRRDQVTAIIVGPMNREGTMVSYMTHLAGRPQGHDGSVYWWTLR